MRYINLRLTYLLTYLLVQDCCKDDARCLWETAIFGVSVNCQNSVTRGPIH